MPKDLEGLEDTNRRVYSSMKNMSNRVLRKAGAIFDKILAIFFVAACVISVFVLLSINLELVTRNFLRHSLVWVPEAVAYSLLFITFFSAAWVLRKEGHVKMDLMLNMLAPRAQAMLNIITSILGALIWLVIAVYTAQVTWSLFQAAELTVAVVEIPKAPLIAVISVGTFLLFIQSLRRIYGFVGSWTDSARPRTKPDLGGQNF